MISPTDFEEKKLITITSGEYDVKDLAIKDHTLCLKKDGQIIHKLPLISIQGIFIIGEATLTSSLIKNCQEYGISLFLLNKNFKLVSAIVSCAQGNYLLRQKQYAWDEKTEIFLSKKLIHSKISNQIRLLQRVKKRKAAALLQELLEKRLSKCSSNSEVLGVEGYASKLYFADLFSEYNWLRRAPQTREDITNLLLDIGYSYLFNIIDSLLSLFGFDTYKGYYHKLFFQRKSLVCDCTEPFRCIVDHALYKAYQLKMVNEKDFEFHHGSYSLNFSRKPQTHYSRIFIDSINEHKRKIFLFVQSFYRYLMTNGKHETFNYSFPLR